MLSSGPPQRTHNLVSVQRQSQEAVSPKQTVSLPKDIGVVRRKAGSATKDLSGAGRKNVVGETACGLQRKIPRRGDEKGQSSRIPSRACVLSPCETL
jgi:hypothetical protein